MLRSGGSFKPTSFSRTSWAEEKKAFVGRDF